MPIAIIILHNYNTHDTDECTTVDLLCTCNTYKLGIIGAAGTGWTIKTVEQTVQNNI